MKTFALVGPAIVVVAAVSCGHADLLPAPPLDTVQVELSVSMADFSFKSDIHTGTLPGEIQINRLDYYVFDREGRLETVISQSDGQPVTKPLHTGLKTIYAMANMENTAFEHCRTLSEFETVGISFAMHAKDNFPMSGRVDVAVGLPSSERIVIPVTRYLCRLYVAPVITAMSGPLEGEEVRIGNIYLSNVLGNCLADGGMPETDMSWYNCFGRPDGGGKQDRIDVASDSSFPEWTFSPLKGGAYLYFFPNNTEKDRNGWETDFSARYTRVIVEAYIRGVRYFYPVNLNGAVRNHSYRLNLTITRPGSADPDTFVFGVGQGILVEVGGFEEGQTLNIVY